MLRLSYGDGSTTRGEVPSSNFLPETWDPTQAPQIYGVSCRNGVFPCSGNNRAAINPLTGQFVPQNLSALAIGSLAFQTIVVVFASFLLWFWLVRHYPATRLSAFTLLFLIASFNFFIGMFNFIPLLPLDGGHIAGALWEAARRGWARLRGSPDPGYVDVARMLPVAYGVGALLLVMGVILIYADIVNPVRLS